MGQGIQNPSVQNPSVAGTGELDQDDPSSKDNPRTITVDRMAKAVVRYGVKARVLSGQDSNPWNTINLFPVNPDMPTPLKGTSLATHHMKRGQDALTAWNAKLPLLSHGQAKADAQALAGKLPQQKADVEQAKAAVEDAQAKTLKAGGTAGSAASAVAKAEAKLAQVRARPDAAAAGVAAAEQRQAATRAALSQSAESTLQAFKGGKVGEGLQGLRTTVEGTLATATAGLNTGKAKVGHAVAQVLQKPQLDAAEQHVIQKLKIEERAKDALTQQHDGFVAASQEHKTNELKAAKTTEELENAKRIAGSGHGSAETFEGFWSNGKDGGQTGGGLTMGTTMVTNIKAWAQGSISATKAVTDLGVRTTLSGVSSLASTGLGTELGAALATKLPQLAVNTETGAALGGKFAGRWGSLAGGVLTGAGSVATAVGVGYLTDHKDKNGKSIVDRYMTDPLSSHFDPHRNKDLNAVLTELQPVTSPVKHVAKAMADATDHLSDGVRQATSWVGSQAGSAAGGRGALTVRSSAKVVRREIAKVELAKKELQTAANEVAARSKAVENVQALWNAATTRHDIGAAEKQMQAALTAKGEAVMAHTARQAEHDLAEEALKKARGVLGATGAGTLETGTRTFGRMGSIAAKSVLGWNPAKVAMRHGATEIAETASSRFPILGSAASGAVKLFSHAGALGAAVSGVVEYATDDRKVKEGTMTNRHRWGDVTTQAINGGLTSLAGAAAGAWAGAEAGGTIGIAGGPLGLAVGALGGAVVGTVVSLGAGVVLDRAEHAAWNHLAPQSFKDWFNKRHSTN